MSPVRQNVLSGDMFLYASGRVAFESFPTTTTSAVSTQSFSATFPPNKCILLGGLSDGMFPVPYTSELATACAEVGWSLIQPILSSSYTGFGHGSLDHDVQEMDELLDYLVSYRGATNTAIVGHSTGTQDIVHYLKHGKNTETVRVVALQAPVSDRESVTICRNDAGTTHEQHMKELQSRIQHAHDLRENGNEQEMMPRAAFWAPITASRYLDLFDRGGNDDYFSSDLTDAELRQRLGHIGTNGTNLRHCLVAWSGSDEYVPDHVDGEALLQRLCQAMKKKNGDDDDNSADDQLPKIVPLFIPTGNHNLSSRDGQDGTVFVEKLKGLLQQQSSADF